MSEASLPDITRLWFEIEDETDEYCRENGVWFSRHEGVFKTVWKIFDQNQPLQRLRHGYSTDSIGDSRPSTLARIFVNLQMKAYTKRDSHRSEGCLALLGGQI